MARPWLALALLAFAGLSALAHADDCDAALRSCSDSCAQHGLAAVTNVCKATPAGNVKLCVCGQQKVATAAADELPAARGEANTASELVSDSTLVSSSALSSTSSTSSSSSSSSSSGLWGSSTSSALVQAAEEFAESLGIHAPAPVVTHPSMSDAAMAEALGSSAAESSSSGMPKMPCHHAEGASSDSDGGASSALGASTDLLNAIMGRRFGPFPMPMPAPGSVSVVRMFPVNVVDPFFGIRQAFLTERMQLGPTVVVRITSSDGPEGASSSDDADLPLPMAFPEQAARVAAPQQLPSEEARRVSDLMNSLMARVFLARTASEAEVRAQQLAAQAQQRAQQERAQRERERAEREEAVESLVVGLLLGLATVFSAAAAVCCVCGPFLRRRRQQALDSDVLVVAEADDAHGLGEPLIADAAESDGDEPQCGPHHGCPHGGGGHHHRGPPPPPPHPHHHHHPEIAHNPAYGAKEQQEVATVEVIRFD